MATNDRVLVLKVADGKQAKDSAGAVDSRLFTGSNKLHGVYDERTGMWNMRYETGALPGAMQQKFITFEQLEDFARKYFATRNVEIVEIINV
jgi:hypothetical protein